MAYKFTDYTTDSDDIKGADYLELISTCFLNSYYFSLIYFKESRNIDELDSHLIKELYSDEWPGTPGTSHGGIMKIYKCNYDTERIIKTHVKSLFSWNTYFGDNNPEDISFYRKDKSIFFYSIIHEGECFIINTGKECVKSIVCKNGWEYQDIKPYNKIYF